MPSDRRTYLDWHMMERAAQTITDQMVIAGCKPTMIVAIGAGGLIPAAMLTYWFGKQTARQPETHSVYAKSYRGNERYPIASDLTIHDKRRIDEHKHGTLIVDDIADSGQTLKHFLGIFPFAQTATFVLKQRSPVKPDFHGLDVSDELWVVFPWEKN